MAYYPAMDLSEQKALIYTTISAIPKGKVCSYGRIAQLSGLKGYARFVAKLLKALPSDSTLPWHRVIRSDGHIAFAQNSPQFLRQTALLTNEGVTINNGKIKMSLFAWM